MSLFPPGLKQQGGEIDHVCLVLSLKMVELYLHSRTHIHGVLLNYLKPRDKVTFLISPISGEED
jgi:hypothetical protein